MTNTLLRPLPLALGGMLTLAAAMGIGRFVYTPILPAMAEGLGLDASGAGLLASANFVGYLLGAVVMTLPRLPGERRTWALAGLAMSVASTALSGAFTLLPVLALVRFASGVASGFAFVGITAHVLDLLARQGRGDLSAILFVGPGAGILASSLLVGALSADGAGWRELWFACAVLGGILFVAVWRLVPAARLPATAAVRPVAHASPAPASGDTGALVRTVLSYGLFGFAYVITATFIVAITRENPDLRPYEHIVWPLVGLASMPSVAVANVVARRIGPARAYAIFCLVEAMGVVASVAWPTPAGIVMAALALGATFIALTSLGLAVAKPFGGSDSRRLIGLMTVAFGTGQIVGPGIGGWARAATGSFATPSYAAAATLVLCAALILSVPRRMPTAG